MSLELALKTVKVGSWGPCGSRTGSARVVGAPVEGISFSHHGRVTTLGEGASLRLAHIVCSESARIPSKPKRKQKPRVDGPTKNELKLLNELQEFIALHDLPPTDVPTTTELSRHGRQDLANQVRRKGYKLIAQLLEHACTAESGEKNQSQDSRVPAGENFDVSKVSANDAQGLCSAELNKVFLNDVKEQNLVGSSFGGVSEGPGRFGTKHANVNGYVERVVEESLGDQFVHVPEDLRDYRIKGQSAGRTLQERAEKSIQDRDRETYADGSGQEEYETDGEEHGEDDVGEYHEYINGEKSDAQLLDDIAVRKADLLKAKILKYLENRKEDLGQPNSLQDAEAVSKKLEAQEYQDEIVSTDIELGSTQKFTIEKELDRLKSLLRSRELELAEITRQLEEAKGILALTHSKARAEFVHAKQLAIEQDMRLQVVEQTLSQLKQVHLEWWGEASQVELAGSFNGWQHTILLEPDYSSEIPKPDGARGPMMWGKHLCLYPGVYEIKFVIDGTWQVDHRREIVMRDTIQNNILRVD